MATGHTPQSAASRAIRVWTAHPVVLLIALAAVTAFFGAFARHGRIYNDSEDFMARHDPALASYEEFMDRFGSDLVLAIAVHADDLFTGANLRYVKTLTERAAGLPHVDSAMSPINAEIVLGENGAIEVRELGVDLDPDDPESVVAFRDAALAQRMLRNRLLSEDGRTAVVMLTMEEAGLSMMGPKIELTAAARELVESLPPPDGVVVHLAGSPVIDAEFDALVKRDNRLLIPLSFVLMGVFVALIYREIRFVVAAALVGAVSLVWTVGTMELAGHWIDSVGTMIPVLIVVIALSGTIHLITNYQSARASGQEPADAVATMLRHTTLACLLATVTTCAGFGSIGLSDIPSMARFGVFAAVGVAYTFVVYMTLVPALLLLWRGRKSRVRGFHGAAAGGFARLARFIETHRALIFGAVVATIAVSAIGFSRLHVETQVFTFFKEDNRVRRAFEFIEDNMAGAATIEILVDTKEHGGMKRPDVLRSLAALQDYIDSVAVAERGISLADYVRELNVAFHDGDPAYDRIPDSEPVIAQLLLLAEFGDISQFVQDDYRLGRLSFLVEMVGSVEANAFIDSLRERAKETFPPDVAFEITGFNVVMLNTDSYLVRSQIESYALAFFVILTAIVVVMRSLKVGLIAMVPNVLPILMTMGLMGWAGINVDAITIMISCVAIGIAVDATIHFLIRYRAELHRKHDEAAAVHETLQHVGRAITYAASVVIGGFFILVVSSFNPTVTFGLLVAMTMAFAIFADLIVTPFLMLAFKPFGRFDDSGD